VIIIVEPMRVGMEHQAFNAGLLEAVIQAFPGKEVLFMADQSHLESVRELLPVDINILWAPVMVADRRATLLGRLPADIKIVWQIRKLMNDPANHLIFSSVTISLLWALRLLPSIPATRAVAVIHGGLAELQWQPRYNLIKRWTSIRLALLRAPAWIKFVVLEQSILNALEKYSPDLIARFDVLLHPLPPDLTHAGVNVQKQAMPLTIGLLGLATPQKGLFRFLELAEMLQSKDVHFVIAGRIHASFQEAVASRLKVLEFRPKTGPMPRSVFRQRLEQITYAAFFFEGKHYTLTASGVLLDCIAMGIPLLGYRYPVFDLLEAEAGGDIGFFCEPGGEVEIVRNLAANFDMIRYRQQREAMRRLHASRSPEALGKKIRQLLYTQKY